MSCVNRFRVSYVGICSTHYGKGGERGLKFCFPLFLIIILIPMFLLLRQGEWNPIKR